jgi:predicted HD superfamily hydrolase involved in NAD metabolism
MTRRETPHTPHDEELLERAQTLARKQLSDGRYAHTLRVADTAERLARLHGTDPYRTRLAALLHDAAREVGADEALGIAGRWGVPVGEPERESPKLLHGPIAAELARRELGITDEEILEAVRVHTVAAPEIGPIALAVYVADKIEPARDYPSADHLRELAQRDLRSAAAETLKRVRAHNDARGRSTHPSSLAALQYLERTR